MKLDTSNTNIAALLTALRYACAAPKLSAEDRQVLPSAHVSPLELTAFFSFPTLCCAVV
jgi:hypothetical protein